MVSVSILLLVSSCLSERLLAPRHKSWKSTYNTPNLDLATFPMNAGRNLETQHNNEIRKGNYYYFHSDSNSNTLDNQQQGLFRQAGTAYLHHDNWPRGPGIDRDQHIGNFDNHMRITLAKEFVPHGGLGGPEGPDPPLRNPKLFYIIGGFVSGIFLILAIVAIICCLCRRYRSNSRSSISLAAKANRLKIKAGILECPNKHPINRTVLDYTELTHIPSYGRNSFAKCNCCDSGKKLKRRFYRCQFSCHYDICKACYKAAKRIQSGPENVNTSTSSEGENRNFRSQNTDNNATLSDIDPDMQENIPTKDTPIDINESTNTAQNQDTNIDSNHYRPHLNSDSIPLRKDTLHTQNPVGESNLHYVFNAGDFGAFKENPGLFNMQRRAPAQNQHHGGQQGTQGNGMNQQQGENFTQENSQNQGVRPEDNVGMNQQQKKGNMFGN